MDGDHTRQAPESLNQIEELGETTSPSPFTAQTPAKGGPPS